MHATLEKILMMQKNLTILGSTGSIGRNLLQIVQQFPDRLRVKALAAKNNTRLLAQQIEQFNPQVAVVYDAASAQALHETLPVIMRLAFYTVKQVMKRRRPSPTLIPSLQR